MLLEERGMNDGGTLKDLMVHWFWEEKSFGYHLFSFFFFVGSIPVEPVACVDAYMCLSI